uniref:Putative secreted protein n=1 Tax=Anopheles darlingi TaxID=43151 RepID=A0A2M4D7S8_ANODA
MRKLHAHSAMWACVCLCLNPLLRGRDHTWPHTICLCHVKKLTQAIHGEILCSWAKNCLEKKFPKKQYCSISCSGRGLVFSNSQYSSRYVKNTIPSHQF